MSIPPRRAGLGLALLALACWAAVLVPVFLIRPFVPQSPTAVAVAFGLRRWSPWLTLIALLVSGWLAARLWRGSGRALPRVLAAFLLLLIAGSAWGARQNHFEWMFAPLPDARFVRAGSADFVAPREMVLAVERNGDAVAYPVRQLSYHHVVEDEVGRVPIVATY